MLKPILSPAAANNTGLESDLARKSADTLSQASKFNLDAAAIAFYNGATSVLIAQALYSAVRNLLNISFAGKLIGQAGSFETLATSTFAAL